MYVIPVVAFRFSESCAYRRLSSHRTLCLDLILAAVHVVDLREVVSSRRDGVDGANGSEVFLQMSLLSQKAHLKHEHVSIDHVFIDMERYVFHTWS